MRQCIGQLVAHFERQLFYLIKEQRTADSKLQLACGLLSVLIGAEEFGLQLCQGGVVAFYRNQRSSSAGAGLMNAVCQALLAGTGLTLQQDVMVGAGNAARLMLQRQKFAGFANHAVQAVTAAVAGCMGNGSFQILNGHGKHQSTFYLAANLNRHNSGNILKGSVLGNPSDFTTLCCYAMQRFFDRNMLVVQEHVLQALMSFQTLAAVFVAVFHAAVLAKPVNGYRQLLHHNAVDAPSLQHVQVLLDGIFHRHQQAQKQIIWQIVLIQGKEGNNIADFAVYADRRTAGITGMAVLNPHFRTEHQKGHVMLARNADAGGTNILLQNTHALNILDNALEERHSVVFDYIAVFINQQHAQVMDIEMLLALLIKTVNVFDDEFMRLLVRDNLFVAQLIDFGHSFVRQMHSTATLPAVGNPRMHVGVNNTLFHKLSVISSQLILISSLTNHVLYPPQLSGSRLPSAELLFINLAVRNQHPACSIIALFPVIVLQRRKDYTLGRGCTPKLSVTGINAHMRCACGVGGKKYQIAGPQLLLRYKNPL